MNLLEILLDNQRIFIYLSFYYWKVFRMRKEIYHFKNATRICNQRKRKTASHHLRLPVYIRKARNSEIIRFSVSIFISCLLQILTLRKRL